MTKTYDDFLDRPVAQARDVPLDSHLHTELSPDSAVPLELYCAQAAERGVREIAITDHLDFMPGAPAYGYVEYERREREVRAAAERWAGKVTIRFGVELTYESRYEDQIREHLRTHSYDYSIGSVHAMSDGPYERSRIATFVEGKTIAEAVAPYFAEVAAAIRSGLFDTLGHMDQCKRWMLPWFLPADYAAAPELYEPLLVALVESGMALEVNASGLRHPDRRDLPGAVGREPVPRARRGARDRRLGLAPAALLRLRARGGVRDRGPRRVRSNHAGTRGGPRRPDAA